MKNKNYLKLAACVIGVFFINLKLNAQVGNDVIGARSTAMGGVATTFSDLWSTNNNQAGLGFVKELAGGVYYENRFLLKATGYKAGAFVIPTKSGALGLSVTSIGYNLYNQTKAGLSYGQRFGNKISFGVQINYLSTSLSQDYGKNSTVTGAIGLIAKLSDELSMGVHIYNPTKSKFVDYNNEKIPTIMKLGFTYQFSKKVLLSVETEKDMDFTAQVKAGVEYHILEVLYLRAGISTNPTQSSFGFGLNLKDFKIQISSSYHQTLGLTPGISLIYQKSKSHKVSNPSIQ